MHQIAHWFHQLHWMGFCTFSREGVECIRLHSRVWLHWMGFCTFSGEGFECIRLHSRVWLHQLLCLRFCTFSGLEFRCGGLSASNYTPRSGSISSIGCGFVHSVGRGSSASNYTPGSGSISSIGWGFYIQRVGVRVHRIVHSGLAPSAPSAGVLHI